MPTYTIEYRTNAACNCCGSTAISAALALDHVRAGGCLEQTAIDCIGYAIRDLTAALATHEENQLQKAA